MVNQRVQNAVLGCNLKNNRVISVCFQGKPFNITVTQVYAPTSNAEEAEVERDRKELDMTERLNWTEEYCAVHFKFAKTVKVKVTQSCPTPCNPKVYTVHGIL